MNPNFTDGEQLVQAENIEDQAIDVPDQPEVPTLKSELKSGVMPFTKARFYSKNTGWSTDNQPIVSSYNY